MSNLGLTPFSCPEEMIHWSKKVFAGEYTIPYKPEAPPKILDIGANCGAFSLWATEVWPGCLIHAYEPAQINYHYLTHNMKDLANVITHRAAVLTSDRTKLYCGKTNQGEASFFPELGQNDDAYELPPIIRPDSLPEAQILKVDTEGAELEIISALLKAGRTYDAIMFEFHRESDYLALTELLQADYHLMGAHLPSKDCGVMKYLRKDLV